ncbi:MAG: hypothetical protein IJJ28_04555, partial [Lentisphaeria bacterium]|nr:hypothetical protein [Lentisphaeria bacterium]
MRLSDFEAKRGSRTEVEVNKTKTVLDGVNGLVGQLNSAKGEFDEAMNFLRSRGKWTRMLQELQRITPDGMWYVVVEGVGDEAAEGENPGGGDGGPGALGDDGAMRVVNNPFAVAGFPITGAAALGNLNSDMSGMGMMGAIRKDLREVKRLRLVGYTLELDNQWRLQSELAKRLKDSEFFAPEWKITVNRQVGNMSGFEIFLQLKEPIRK